MEKYSIDDAKEILKDGIDYLAGIYGEKKKKDSHAILIHARSNALENQYSKLDKNEKKVVESWINRSGIESSVVDAFFVAYAANNTISTEKAIIVALTSVLSLREIFSNTELNEAANKLIRNR